MKIAIVGSRDYPNLEAVKQYVRSLTPNTIIVSGGANGVDKTAELTAIECNLETIIYKPDWNKHGKQAGFLRNIDIVRSSDKVVAFIYKKSKGTTSSINLAKSYGKPLIVFDDLLRIIEIRG